MLFRNKVEILLSDLEASVSGNNIRVLNVLLIQSAEAPVGILSPLGILEFSDLAEDSDLLDQALQGTNVDGKGRVIGIILNTLLFVLTELLNPNGYHLLQLGASEEAERGILASGFIIALLDQLFKTITEGIAQIRELLLVSEGAQGSHNLLPVREIGVVHNIPQVLADDGRKQTHVVGSTSLLREVVLLGLLNALRTTTDGDHEGIRHTVLLKGNLESLVELSKKQRAGNLLLGFAF
jgi:hypothetical protein